MLLTLIALSAAQTNPAPTLAPPSTPAAEPKKICRMIIMTGSRLGERRFCKSRIDWAFYDRAMENTVGELVDSRMPPPKDGFERGIR